MTTDSAPVPAPWSPLPAILAGLATALVFAGLLWQWSPDLALLPLLLLPGGIAGYLRGRDGSACGLVAGGLALTLALVVVLLLREADEPLTVLEYLADWGYRGAGILLGNAVAGIIGTLLREERGG